MTSFDFDEIIDRVGSNAIAVDGFREFLFDEPDLILPCPDDEALVMWVADMAFATAPVALEAMRQRLDLPIFGYTAPIDDSLTTAFIGWCERRYGWAPDPDHHVTAPGIVPALYDLVSFIAKPGDKVLTHTPAYEPFESAVTNHGCELATSDLLVGDTGAYTFDPTDLAAKLADPAVSTFILCHPHNPTGRSWRDEELRAMAELCFANDVIVISDEIHCDLLRAGRTHTPLASLFPQSDQIITCMSSSKTFNLAGLGLANVVIPHDGVRGAWQDRFFPVVNPISAAAATAVFNDGDAWLAELTNYLDANFELVRDTVADRLPHARFQIPEATYLAWIDLSAYFEPVTNLTHHFAEQAGVLIEGGAKFIANGDRCLRINLACPRSVLETALDRMIDAMPAVAGPEPS